MMTSHIHPIFDKILDRATKEERLNQHSKVLWFTGLSGAGKSTLAAALEKELFQRGFIIEVLDGDNIRTGICAGLGFSEDDRTENIRRVAETAKLFLHAGVITLCSFVSPTHELRELAKKIIGEKDFLEVYVNASFEECSRRDVKGLYKKALSGEIKNFTGLDAPFEAPSVPFLELPTAELNLEQCLDKMLEVVLPLIEYERH